MEDVGRPGTREAGDRVEVGLGDGHDEADGREDPLGPGEISGVRLGPGGDAGGPLPDERRRVGHAADHDRALAETGLDGVGPHAGCDRQHSAHAGLGEDREHQRHDVGLHRDDGVDARLRGVTDREPRMGVGQFGPTGLGRLDHMEPIGTAPPVVDEATEQRLGHLAATDHLELRHGATP